MWQYCLASDGAPTLAYVPRSDDKIMIEQCVGSKGLTIDVRR